MDSINNKWLHIIYCQVHADFYIFYLETYLSQLTKILDLIYNFV